MRKETSLAILAGVAIGLIFAFGTWRVSKSIKKNNNNAVEVKQTPPTSKNLSLAISNYKNFDIVTQSPIILSGTAIPQRDIVVLNGDIIHYLKAEDEGEFEQGLELTPGLSETKIVSFDEEGTPTSLELFLVYSSEFEKYLESTNGKKPTSYVGTITDISGATIQIKAEDGSIMQASTGEDTTYINTLKKNQEVKLTDLAIGDYVVIMGLKNGNTVLDGKRVLITSGAPKNKVELIWGKVKTTVKKELVVTKPDGNEESFTMPKKWDGPDIEDLIEGQTVIIAGTEGENEKFEVKTIITTTTDK